MGELLIFVIVLFMIHLIIELFTKNIIKKAEKMELKEMK
ncbi:hypothetical protein mflW37_0280 [Mesoplasma florum W37]|uniref:Uncharacterized protein n=1 Tax=Mesoplasma florum TaxID=2151 RepID=A0AAD2JDY6_MESFO|nr:hypothetical protein mflW37_0280 [Mesoplasma florum W37]AVN65433.1 hypothetical protein MflW12_0280 [Mesoplasma florum]